MHISKTVLARILFKENGKPRVNNVAAKHLREAISDKTYMALGKLANHSKQGRLFD